MIYVDLTECVPQGSIIFHGGANYGIRMSKLLSKYYKTGIILPEYENTEVYDALKDSDVIFVKGKKIHEIEYCDNDILFIPLISTSRLNVLKHTKLKHNNIRIFTTIHGIRRFDLKPDTYDRYYYSGLKRILYMPLAYLEYHIICVGTKKIFKQYIPYCDKVFTDSNDSMQKILSIYTPKYINLFFLGSENAIFKDTPGDRHRFLFLSGGRPEKNLIRVLVAFLEFAQKVNTKVELNITGLSETHIKMLRENPEIQTDLLERFVKMYGYLPSNEIDKLYQDCGIILYPSKSEGFGLPIVEACFYGKTIVTSAITATPEILGSSGIYVDPYNHKSILNGIENAYNNWERHQIKVINMRPILEKLVIKSEKDFIAEFEDK